MKFKYLFLLVGVVSGFISVAQKQDRPPRIVLMGAQAAYQTASGQWANQFNNNFSIGAMGGYKFANNWVLTLSGMYAFGDQVNDPQAIMAPLLTEGGQALNSSGSFATFNVYTRATYGFLNVERILNFGQLNENSGPILGLGGGYLFHWIRIDNAGNNIAAIQGNYSRGYDELSHGFALKASAGYLYLSPNRRVNFKLSFEIISGYTQNIRGYNYATGVANTAVNNNLLYGVNLAWYIPIYRGGKVEEYYYD